MCGNNQSLFLSIPKGEKPVAYTIVESSKLPYLSILQLLEDVNFYHSFLNCTTLEKVEWICTVSLRLVE